METWRDPEAILKESLPDPMDAWRVLLLPNVLLLPVAKEKNDPSRSVC